MGKCYEYGWGVDQSTTQAMEWYRRAAEKNNNQAQLRLGYGKPYAICVRLTSTYTYYVTLS